MKLNNECIRAILLTAEEECTNNSVWQFDENFHKNKYLEPFSNDEIFYHIKQCNLSGFFTTCHSYEIDTMFLISDLSPSGHAFLADIRSETVWNKIKEKGTMSLPVVIELAKDLALAYYQKI